MLIHYVERNSVLSSSCGRARSILMRLGSERLVSVQKSTFPQDEKEQEVLCKDCDVYVGKMILKLVLLCELLRRRSSSLSIVDS